MDDVPSGCKGILSICLYRFLLLAYPRAFCEEYAAEMVLVFSDAYRDASEQQRILGVLRLWSHVFVDFVKSVCLQWRAIGGSGVGVAMRCACVAYGLLFI